jgi:hypothetical protein
MFRSIQQERIRLLIFLGLGAISLIILAAGMSSLELQTGQILMEPIEESVVYLGESDESEEPAQFIDPTNLTTVLVLSGIALIILFAAIRWKQIRIALFVLVLFAGSILAMIYLYSLYGEVPARGEEEEGFPSAEQENRISPDLLDNPPDWIDPISIAVTIGIAAIAVGTIIFLVRKRWREDQGTLDLIAAEAEAALADIQSGGDLRDAVLRCYIEMSQGLRRSIGLVRQEGMTPREFESALTNAGLPYDSVHRLTRLFESVRYGQHEATEGEIREAVDCLQEIVNAATKKEDDVARQSVQARVA